MKPGSSRTRLINPSNDGLKGAGTKLTAAALNMRLLPVVAVVLMACMAMTVSSCKEEHKEMMSGRIDPEKFPTMKTTDVSTLVSDSGVTRYKIASPLWLMFDQAKVPVWRFPKGLHLEKYDDFFRKDATVDCDSATYYKNDQIWRLDGYVRIANVLNERFLTNQLYWDQRRQKIYSDSFIHIEKSDRIIEGYGFESNEKLTNYRVLNVSGIFPVDKFKNGGGGAQPDSSGASATAPVVQPARSDSSGMRRSRAAEAGQEN